MKIDENTGLPELPEGYFWRVKSDIAGTKVHLMRKRKYLPGVSVGSTYIYLSPARTTQRAIELAASDVLDALSEKEVLRPFKGDYPPKMLGA